MNIPIFASTLKVDGGGVAIPAPAPLTLVRGGEWVTLVANLAYKERGNNRSKLK